MPRPHLPEFHRRAVELARERVKPIADLTRSLDQRSAYVDGQGRPRGRRPPPPLLPKVLEDLAHPGIALTPANACSYSVDMSVDAPAGGPSSSLGMIPALPRSRRSDLVVYVPVVGVAIYASMATMALGFYNRLNVTFEEVGLSYTSLLTRALLVVAVVTPPLALLAGAVGTVTASWKVANLLFTVLDSPHVSWRVKALLLTATLELAGSLFLLSWRAQDIGRTVLILAVMAASIAMFVALVEALKWAARGPLGRVYVTSAVLVLVMATSFYIIGGSSADRMLTGDGHRQLVASLGVVRWPMPVAVAGDPATSIAQPPSACFPLLIGSNDGYHVLLERHSDYSRIVRVPVDQVTLRSGTRYRTEAEPAPEPSICHRSLALYLLGGQGNTHYLEALGHAAIHNGPPVL